MAVTRSTGIDTGYLGVRAGAGLTGATPTLDSIVQAAADALAQAYGLDVEIRFNSDRMSGGAYMRVDGADCGVTAKLWDVSDGGWLRAGFDKYPEIQTGDWADYCAERGLDPEGPAQQITLVVFIGAPALASLEWANSGTPDHRYGKSSSALALD